MQECSWELSYIKMEILVLFLLYFFGVNQVTANTGDKYHECKNDTHSCHYKSMKEIFYKSCKTSLVLCTDETDACKKLSELCRYQWIKNLCPKTCNACPDLPCGLTGIAQSRSISGTNAKPGAWPWQALLLLDTQALCGGTLISQDWVVTAAHCVEKVQDVKRYHVVLGAHDLSKPEPNRQGFRISEIKIYSPGSIMENDFALVKLVGNANYTDEVRPACLPSSYDIPKVGTKCFVTGWGRMRHKGNQATTLQQANLPLVSKTACEKFNSKVPSYPSLSDNMMCAGHGPGDPSSSCNGDSGGPLVCPTGPGGAFQLHGVVSWGSATCDTYNAYPVFARVTAFRSWIRQQTNL